IDEREVVRRDGKFVVRLEGTDGFELFRGEGEKIAKLPYGADGVLRLPAPVVPVVMGDVAPERVAPRLTGRFFFVTVVHHGRGVLRDESGTLVRLVHRKRCLH